MRSAAECRTAEELEAFIGLQPEDRRRPARFGRWAERRSGSTHLRKGERARCRRDWLCLELRLRGWTYRAIAERLRFRSVSSPYHACRRELARRGWSSIREPRGADHAGRHAEGPDPRAPHPADRPQVPGRDAGG